MASAEPPVDELLAAADARRAAGARLPEIIERTTGVAMDQRRLVQAVTNASGELRGLTLHPAAMSFGGQELATMVIEAAEQATAYARQRCFNEIALVLGDHATAELEELIGPSPARVAGWDSAPTRPAGDEDSVISGAGDSLTFDAGDSDDPLTFDPSTLRSDR